MRNRGAGAAAGGQWHWRCAASHGCLNLLQREAHDREKSEPADLSLRPMTVGKRRVIGNYRHVELTRTAKLCAPTSGATRHLRRRHGHPRQATTAGRRICKGVTIGSLWPSTAPALHRPRRRSVGTSAGRLRSSISSPARADRRTRRRRLATTGFTAGCRDDESITAPASTARSMPQRD